MEGWKGGRVEGWKGWKGAGGCEGAAGPSGLHLKRRPTQILIALDWMSSSKACSLWGAQQHCDKLHHLRRRAQEKQGRRRGRQQHTEAR